MPDALLLRFSPIAMRSCPVCRYNLRGLTTDACPECAVPIRLDIGSPSLQIGPFVLAIVSYALGAGFDLVVAIIFSMTTVITASVAAPATWIGPLILIGTLGGLGSLCLVGILAMVRRRSAWNRLPPRRQWTSAILTFVGVGLIHALVGGTIVMLIS